jgi:4,5-DOPA dioxygenase extradiol
MPALFVGHGSPMGAIEPNRWTECWANLGTKLPRPEAILMISAHWLTRGGALVTASEAPAMNYDMYGFPPDLYKITYPAPGNVALANEIASALHGHSPVYADTQWGFDHGTWLILKYMFPKADIPVVQLSMDYSKPPAFHYELAKHLQFLRSKGTLILCSGNIVHNLNFRNPQDPPMEWALEFDRVMHANIEHGNHQAVVDFQNLGRIASLSHPTYDHFLPILYFLGVQTADDKVSVVCEGFQWPAVSMRTFLLH